LLVSELPALLDGEQFLQLPQGGVQLSVRHVLSPRRGRLTPSI
jgi:hypothetical protein